MADKLTDRLGALLRTLAFVGPIDAIRGWNAGPQWTLHRDMNLRAGNHQFAMRLRQSNFYGVVYRRGGIEFLSERASRSEWCSRFALPN